MAGTGARGSSEGRRERKKRESARSIVDAARDIVREVGAESLTVERIAERAGVSAPTVFNLVGKREHLWAAIVDRAMDDLDLETLAEAEDGLDAAQGVMAAMADMVLADPVVFRALLAHWGQAVRLMRGNPGLVIEACLDRAGVARSRHAAQLVVAGFIGLLHLWSLGVVDDAELRASSTELVERMAAPGR